MTWDMLREMHAGKMTIGGHTMNHTILARLPREQQATEIRGCGLRIAEELGVTMRSFAYPVGGRDAFNADTRACLREAGVETAYSYYGGFRRFGDWDNYDVRRIEVAQSTTFKELRARTMFPWI
jgi:peptidoglycan/xylan/chitin deacetylase (PgdA/CDA1 family)